MHIGHLAVCGDIEYAPLWAGESVDTVNDILSAGEVVHRLARDAEAALAEANQHA